MAQGLFRFIAIFIAIVMVALAVLALLQKDRQLYTEIVIDATPESVWRVLIATNQYPDWNPFLVSLKGNLAVGEKLQVTARPPGGSEMSFTPTVLSVIPNRELIWRGDIPIPGMFRGEHRFRLEAAGEGRTKLIQSEQFTGMLIGPLMRSTLDRTELGFAEMNLAVKIQTEQRR